MYLGDNVYYLAHPLTTCGTIEENLEDEQIIADKIEKCFKSAVLTRPLTLIPITLTSEEAMPICKQMIDLCDAVIMTGDWQKSEGCTEELLYAYETGREIIFEKEINFLCCF